MGADLKSNVHGPSGEIKIAGTAVNAEVDALRNNGDHSVLFD
ncbi:hypothetical protein [Nitrobacter sp. TKz-YC02]